MLIIKVLTVLPFAAALRIVGLGSSFAAGPGLSRGGNYASILADKLKAQLTDLSMSGSTLSGIDSQLMGIPSNADIVTITSGGNDLGYIGGLLMDSTVGSLFSGASISESDLAKRYSSVLERIQKKAPKAKVYVVEYLTILGPDAKARVNVPFNESRIEHHRGVAATLQRATAKATEGKEYAHLIPVAKSSERHGLGSQDPWVNGNSVAGRDGAQWHPRSAGMKAIANMLYEIINQKE